MGYSLVYELSADAEGLSHVTQGEGAVGLQQLAVGQYAHLSDVVAIVWSKQPVLLHLLLHSSCVQVNTQEHILRTSIGGGKMLQLSFDPI